MRRYQPRETWTAPGADGPHIPVRVDLEVFATHPVWSPGARRSDSDQGLFHTSFRLHHEQALGARGRIEIDGESVDFNGVGHRDHSFGPRDISTTLRGFWLNATFDSGWAFGTMVGVLDPGGEFERTAFFEKGEIQEGVLTKWHDLPTTAPAPREFDIVMADGGGRERVVHVACTGGVNWTGVGPTEWCVGTDRSNPRNFIFTHYFANYQCEGEKGLGFVDRGGRAALLKTPE
jgi:hypothetical protein